MVSLDGVTWLLARDGSVVLERCPNKARHLGVGEWFVPGGKIEGDETPEAACRREIAEEWPGVELLTLDPLPIVEGSRVPPGPRGAFLMRPFVVTVRGEVPEVSGDGVPLRWVPIAEALRSPVPQVRMMVAALLAPAPFAVFRLAALTADASDAPTRADEPFVLVELRGLEAIAAAARAQQTRADANGDYAAALEIVEARVRSHLAYRYGDVPPELLQHQGHPHTEREVARALVALDAFRTQRGRPALPESTDPTEETSDA